jgi:tight adherence protein B
VEGVAVWLACALASVAAFTLAGEVPGMVRSMARARGEARGPGVAGRVRRRVVWTCEHLGHTVPLERLGSMPWLASQVGRVLPVVRDGRLDLTLSAQGCLAFCLVAMAALALAGTVASGSALGAPVGVVAFAVVAATAVGRRESARKAAQVAQVPEVLRALSSALAVGKSMPQAIAHVGGSVGEPLASEFLRASFEIEGGRDVDEAVDGLCRRIDAPGVELVGTALQVSQRTGSSLSELFSRTSRMVMSGVALRRELMVKTSQARLSARVVALVPVVLVSALTLLSPEYRAGLASSAGRACLCVSALLDVGALLWVRRLMRAAME